MYISGIGCISAQKTFEENYFFSDYNFTSNEIFKCLEPIYSKYINPSFSRRLSRLVKFSMTGAILALNDACIKVPDAIISGTGLGCIEDTEKFMGYVLMEEGGLLSPTPFIQSTHNTVNSQLALYLKCRGYNITYSHRIFSFEQAIVDAFLLLSDNPGKNVLAGGFDEITENSQRIKNIYFGKKTGNINGYNVRDGEGAAFFLLKEEKDSSCYAKIIAVETIRIGNLKVKSISEVLENILEKYRLDISDIDYILTGMNGNIVNDEPYLDLKKGILADIPYLFYKHLSGEYFTSSSFAMWCASKMLKTQSIPQIMNYENHVFSKVEHILLLNFFRKRDLSFLLLEKC